MDLELTSILEAQDLESFVAEMRFLVAKNPSLLLRRSVWLNDGDRGRIRAIEIVLGERATIHLCWSVFCFPFKLEVRSYFNLGFFFSIFKVAQVEQYL
mmetsp:Transcript_20228/g.50098  ORF Transcript_20228/g.50098 Transcript_20228/m.50098 type:complete len:98 (-) Transcript_20228:2110-2403(-)